MAYLSTDTATKTEDSVYLLSDETGIPACFINAQQLINLLTGSCMKMCKPGISSPGK